jgi:two-component system, cell cycle sensor histidine kinase and response regulator CckA
MMRGAIEVESEPGAVSTFTVELPAHVVPATAEFVQSASTLETAQGLVKEPDLDTILVVDDDAAIRDLMGRLLVKYGFHVVVGDTGQENLHLARAGQ